MANKSVITEDLKNKILELAQQGHNCRHISTHLGIARETIRKWAIRNDIAFLKRNNPKTQEQLQRFAELVKQGMTAAEAKKATGLKRGIGEDLKKKLGLENAIRSRQEASLDKTLTLEEAGLRLPVGSGEVIGYSQEKCKYVVEADDGFIYYKSSSRLCQGDPRGKSGTPLDEKAVSEKLSMIGYELVPGSFSIKRNPLKAKHLKCGNIRENRLSNFSLQDCPTCTNQGTSKKEGEVKTWVESLGIEVSKYKFKERITRPKEIDIFVPSLNLGIEYCGLYWHRENSPEPRDRTYHKNKLDMATEAGIQLLTVFGHEWRDRQAQVKGYIRSKLNKNETTIYARKTVLKELDKNLARQFLDAYHIQGATTIQVAFGLFSDDDELVAVVSGAQHHRISDQFALNRLCFKDNVSVVGGSSKLNKALCSYARDQGYRKIVTWSDNRWSIGQVYSAMGYEKEEDLPPDYIYICGDEVFSKQSCQKRFLLKKGAVGNTESEMAKSLGYDKMWDCGKIRWTKKL